MAKDDFKKPKSKRNDGRNVDVEFSESLADEDDKEAQERARAAEERVKGD